MALDIAGGLLGLDLITGIWDIARGQGGFWEGLDVALTVLPVAKLAASAFKLRGVLRATQFTNRHCNCFVAGTTVATAEGEKPIEEVREGDWVQTRMEGHPMQAPQIGTVTRIFRSIAPAIVWISLANGSTLGITPGHEVWTVREGWTNAGLLRPGDAFLDATGASVEVTSVCHDPTPMEVYNLEVYGTFTYFAGGVWVHNLSACSVVGDATKHMHHVLPKFLRGVFDGTTVRIGAQLHRQYHGGLYSALYSAGLRKPRAGSWADFLGDTKNGWQTAMTTLIKYTTQFDKQNGTKLLDDLMDQMTRQGIKW